MTVTRRAQFEPMVLSVMTAPDAAFEDRVTAAAAAGFGGIGLRPRHLARERQNGHTDADLRALLADHDVSVVELEVLSGWAGDDAAMASAWSHERELYALADTLGGRHLTVTGTGLVGPVDRAAGLFADLCDRAAEHGLSVALEFLPWTEVPDADHARTIVEHAGRPNGGLLVDTWHHFRGAASDDQLGAIRPESVVAVQFDDGLLSGDGTLLEQTYERMLPGDGEFGLVEFLRLMSDAGVTAPLCVEVISSRLAKLPVGEAARLCADATRSVLDSAFPDAAVT